MKKKLTKLIIMATLGCCSNSVIATDDPLFKEVDVIRSQNGVLITALTAAKSHNRIGDDNVHLRGYNGKLVGPTLRCRAGDLLDITLINKLQMHHGATLSMATKQSMGVVPLMKQNEQDMYTVTNLHTHGLHVSPAGNSDNVLLIVLPGQSFNYEIKIPPDHPAGTFWYHAHVHGSTAVQVGSGMAGALIIEGNIDEVPEIKAASEKIFLLQQPPYDEKGEIESRKDMSPGSWSKGKWLTLLSGNAQPEIKMFPGEVQRWRFIHSGPRESVRLSLEKHQLYEIAVDGLTTGRLDTKAELELFPGYRSDVLIKAGLAGTYALMDNNIQNNPNRSLLAKVIVEGPEKQMSLPSESQLKLVEAFHPVIPDEELTGFQNVHLGIDLRGAQYKLPLLFQIDNRSMGALDSPRYVPLNGVEEWKVTTNLATHPFHIHVNPFLVTKVVTIKQEAVQNPDTKEWGVIERRIEDQDFKPTWHDTFAVSQGQEVYFRTRYTKYIGRFVLHCHILDHEDEGMMQLVEVLNNPIQHHEQGGDHSGHQ